MALSSAPRCSPVGPPQLLLTDLCRGASVPGRLHPSDPGPGNSCSKSRGSPRAWSGDDRLGLGSVVPQVLRGLVSEEPDLLHAAGLEDVEADGGRSAGEGEQRSLRPVALLGQADLEIPGERGGLHSAQCLSQSIPSPPFQRETTCPCGTPSSRSTLTSRTTVWSRFKAFMSSLVVQQNRSRWKSINRGMA